MDEQEKQHEAKTELDLAFDHIFENDAQPSFQGFLDVFQQSMEDATRWIAEKYGQAEATKWQRLGVAIARKREIIGT